MVHQTRRQTHQLLSISRNIAPSSRAWVVFVACRHSARARKHTTRAALLLLLLLLFLYARALLLSTCTNNTSSHTPPSLQHPPTNRFCELNPDKAHASCSAPQELTERDVDDGDGAVRCVCASTLFPACVRVHEAHVDLSLLSLTQHNSPVAPQKTKTSRRLPLRRRCVRMSVWL
jgi:hypothetical protein